MLQIAGLVRVACAGRPSQLETTPRYLAPTRLAISAVRRGAAIDLIVRSLRDFAQLFGFHRSAQHVG